MRIFIPTRLRNWANASSVIFPSTNPFFFFCHGLYPRFGNYFLGYLKKNSLIISRAHFVIPDLETVTQINLPDIFQPQGRDLNISNVKTFRHSGPLTRNPETLHTHDSGLKSGLHRGGRLVTRLPLLNSSRFLQFNNFIPGITQPLQNLHAMLTGKGGKASELSRCTGKLDGKTHLLHLSQPWMIQFHY